MIRFEVSTQIDAPRESVFEYVTDIDRIPEWQAEIVQSRRISDGPMRVGFEFAETARLVFWRVRLVCTVTGFRPNEQFTFEARSNGPVDYEGRLELEAADGGTRVRLAGTARLKGAWRLLKPLVAGDIRKEAKKEMEQLKRNLEPAQSGRRGGRA